MRPERMEDASWKVEKKPNLGLGWDEEEEDQDLYQRQGMDEEGRLR
jgi:hypothetical protein